MRVLVVGHSFLLWRELHKRLSALHRLDPDLDLHLLVPRTWEHPLKTCELGALVEPGYRVWPTSILGKGVPWRYWYVHPTLHLRDIRPDIIHVEQEPTATVFLQVMLARRALRSRAKVVFFTWQNLYRRYWWHRTAIQRFNLRQADYAVAGNQGAADVLRRHGYTGPVAVMPQFGVDEKLFRRVDATDLRARLGLSGSVVGFVGRVVEGKGLLVLLDALAGMGPDVALLLVGQGEFECELRRRATALGIARRTVFAGVVPSDELPRYLSCMDVLALPSVTTAGWKEQFGHVLIEAMSCGVPVVGSDSGEIPNVIGDAGLVCPEGDVGSLRLALNRVLSEPALADELRRRGRERVLTRYTHDAVAAQWYQVYREVMGATGGRRVSARRLAKWAFCATGGLRLLHFVNRQRVRILIYHSVGATPAFLPAQLGVPTKVFTAQMRYCRERYVPLSLGEFLDRRREGRALPERTVIVTFDDGFQNCLTTALPVLKRYDIPSTLFPLTDWVFERRMCWLHRFYYLANRVPPGSLLEAAARTLGEAWRRLAKREGEDRTVAAVKHVLKYEVADRHAVLDRWYQELEVEVPPDWPDRLYLTPDQVRAISAAGMEIGSCGRSHVPMSALDRERVNQELVRSKRLLEECTDKPVRAFAFPFGEAADLGDLRPMLLAAGYECALTAVRGLVDGATDPYHLSRYDMGGEGPIWEGVLGLELSRWLRG